MERADVVVVGSGVMGAAAAWRLSMAGRPVVLLEQFEVGHDRGSSHGAARVFRFSYDDPMYVGMAMEALPLWRELEHASGHQILTVTGGFDAGPTRRLESHRQALGSCGARFELVTGRDVMARYPAVALSPEALVLHQPDAGVLAAARAVRAMVDLATERGAALHQGCRVTGLRRAGEEIDVLTEDGSIRARVAVVTAGPWARPLAASAGIELPVTPSRETVAFYHLREPASMPVFVEWTESPLYALPSPGDGFKTGWHHTGPVADPDVPGDVQGSVIQGMSAWVAERFPGVDPHPHRAESCLYTNTEDERFILERSGPIVLGSACSGHGFKFAPLIGERLATLVLGG